MVFPNFSSSYVPSYTHLEDPENSEVLREFQNPGKPLSTSSSGAPFQNSKKELRINCASDDELKKDLELIPGVGVRTFNKIVTERALNGSFRGAPDFDRRIKGVTFDRLVKLCHTAGLGVSFEDSVKATRNRPRYPRLYINPMLWKEVSVVPEEVDEQNVYESVVLSSWNTGRMSRYSDRYEDKVAHLVRFVADADADIISLQEVYENVVQDLCTRLTEKFGAAWRMCNADTVEEVNGNGLATLYRNEKVRRQSEIKSLDQFLALLPFKRVPEVVLFDMNKKCEESIALINVHLDQTDPSEEISAVASLVRKLRQVLRNHSTKTTLLVVGDFNMNSDALAFTPLRDASLVELFRPPRCSKWCWTPYRTIQSPTTIGGQWYDNIWISERSRSMVKDAWCFDFGGRKQSLMQSGYKYAAQKRASCSDHLPVVAKVQVGHIS
ncbi:hypothetical protein BWQ96_03938 [Gracilariopsis chorda]|uniref:Endonuclease/exonuclease/phosphatase domain-containing protein n=1 Tax=Gracilariopsis chorda TaxID=448386 RepID=A0A2V3IVX6_9FLOR|nr:hypothetical protein BWQ96_03938 [Gracilariopsis chorda]|eukprot:PXF46282.1 hypothetical protein BWQ96_03938 [Gracilariopsis chorda]